MAEPLTSAAIATSVPFGSRQVKRPGSAGSHAHGAAGGGDEILQRFGMRSRQALDTRQRPHLPAHDEGAGVDDGGRAGDRSVAVAVAGRRCGDGRPGAAGWAEAPASAAGGMPPARAAGRSPSVCPSGSRICRNAPPSTTPRTSTDAPWRSEPIAGASGSRRFLDLDHLRRGQPVRLIHSTILGGRRAWRLRRGRAAQRRPNEQRPEQRGEIRPGSA